MADEIERQSHRDRTATPSQGRLRTSGTHGESRPVAKPPPRKRRSLILCFDGTGNKFQGNNSDSNILKIFSCLDQEDENQISYYQPGIGTYVESSSLSKTGRIERIKSWYAKAKDQAVGTSLDSHVMAGYKFLMRYYQPGDDIYFFGFSRGAYTARFLAQMLDSVGLLSQGNEEMQRFAWKTFAKWQTRTESTEAERKQAQETYRYMKAFRQTFSRPVRRIRFMGLFDTVNSVPKFESAWMSRSKFPYQARSSVKIIRHAVSIDERRAKFRQDLVSQQKPEEEKHEHPHLHHLHEQMHHIADRHHHHEHPNGEVEVDTEKPPAKNQQLQGQHPPKDRFQPKHKKQHLEVADQQNNRGVSPARSTGSFDSDAAGLEKYVVVDDDEDEDDPQDIQEIWFPGCHADIGGGWPLVDTPKFKEEFGLSHPPLLWMVREAHKAGLPFDEDALRNAGYLLDEDEPSPAENGAPRSGVPVLQVDGQDIDDATAPMNEFTTPAQSSTQLGHFLEQPPIEEVVEPEHVRQSRQAEEFTHPEQSETPETPETPEKRAIRDALDFAATKGAMHDSLSFGQGTAPGGVISWKIMEYLPFRRMDLQADGKWGTQRWPLPMGEPRDMPDNAWVHWTAIKRMQENKKYKPGTLVEGGGRAHRIAPKNYGIGKWRMEREKGDPIGECYVRAYPGGTDLSKTEGPAMMD